MARMLIVSDSEAMSRLLNEVLGSHPHVEIVGQAWTVQEATKITSEAGPDLVVIASGVALREDAVPLADDVYRANPNAVVIVVAGKLPQNVRQELLDVCAIPLESDIMDLPCELEVLIPDLWTTPQERAKFDQSKRQAS